ncbi:hypothetical protein LTR99_008418 [Exophiala xenobiotica]|uniref:Uncharacterized protein n=1 Tax=Vermiconidia calcicola TaxID=1690605 RepID=A0AAV9Q2P1_9PEZI|nr:hypothetical protein LTR92_008433 [Exophiala xenobiotica]KAK5532808.1 hypothetical protein LTR25_007512 [Vermiconidia calcicola]KAK5546537.1 hypothetical protein LTR23_003284 [Chaetothyriales sp. CCFEE 6169]KAK5270115.1 hypothetical protein LTR96_004615 [Exophiala xenobiotica]KAK5296777.1 hypothetical protein LTR99_008418 [Exophiala xenobiotica]
MPGYLPVKDTSPTSRLVLVLLARDDDVPLLLHVVIPLLVLPLLCRSTSIPGRKDTLRASPILITRMSSFLQRVEPLLAELEQLFAALRSDVEKYAALEAELAALIQLQTSSIGADDQGEDSVKDEDDDDTPPPPPSTPTHHDPPLKAPVRDPGLINLAVSLQITTTGDTDNPPPSQDFLFLLEASDCPTISQFCDRLAKAASASVASGTTETNMVHLVNMVESIFYPPESPHRRIPDLSKVNIKLEEDGYIADLTITPTKLNSSSVFPDLQYRAWYHRNIIKGRGDKAEYAVDVKMTM